MASAPELVDPRGARFNEGVAAGILLLAFVVNQPLVIPALATVLIAGMLLGPRMGPFLAFYAQVIGPRLEPPAQLEDPRPMRCADAFAALLLVLSTAAFVAGNVDVGWSLALLTAVVTGLSAAETLCLGCGIYHALRPRGGTQQSNDDGNPFSPSVPQQSDDRNPGVPAGRSWRARWIGLRTLGRWVTVVDQTSDGAWIVRAGSDRLILPQGAEHFWTLTTCSGCQRELTSVDFSRRQRRALCTDCTVWSYERSSGPDRPAEK